MDDTFYDQAMGQHESTQQETSDLTQDNENQHLVSNDVKMLVTRIEKLHADIRNELGSEKTSDVDYEQIEIWAKEIDILSERVERLPTDDLSVAKVKIAFYLTELEYSYCDISELSTYKDKILAVLEAFPDYKSITTAFEKRA